MLAASRNEIIEWFLRGRDEGYPYMAVICDTFDYEDYPKFFKSREDLDAFIATPKLLQRVMETYDLNADMNTQLQNGRNFV